MVRAKVCIGTRWLGSREIILFSSFVAFLFSVSLFEELVPGQIFNFTLAGTPDYFGHKNLST